MQTPVNYSPQTVDSCNETKSKPGKALLLLSDRAGMPLVPARKRCSVNGLNILVAGDISLCQCFQHWKISDGIVLITSSEKKLAPRDRGLWLRLVHFYI